MDIYFILDGSFSIGPENFQLVRTFVADTVKAFTIHPSATRVGLITFSLDAQLVFPLNAHGTLTDLLTAINAIPYLQSFTRTDLAIKLLMTEGFTDYNGARPLSQGIPRIAVFLTDGRSNIPKFTQQAINELNQGTPIIRFAVGIGEQADIDELQTIASDENFVFLIDDFAEVDLAKLQEDITNEVCRCELTT